MLENPYSRSLEHAAERCRQADAKFRKAMANLGDALDALRTRGIQSRIEEIRLQLDYLERDPQRRLALQAELRWLETIGEGTPPWDTGSKERSGSG